jgi:hypothetical protein
MCEGNRRRLLMAALTFACLSAAGLSGCRSVKSLFGGTDSPDKPTAAPTTTYSFQNGETEIEIQRFDPTVQTETTERPLPSVIRPGSQVIVRGELPLVYLIEVTHRLRVVDTRSNTTIVTFESAPNRIVRITERGVSIGDELIAAGPLPTSIYAIELVADGDGYIRQTRPVAEVDKQVNQ